MLKDPKAPSDFGYLELLKTTTDSSTSCGALEALELLKSNGVLKNMPLKGSGSENLISYLATLPEEVTCQSGIFGNKKKTYRILDAMHSLGPLPISSANEKQSTNVQSKLDAAKECGFSSSMMADIDRTLKALPLNKSQNEAKGIVGNSTCTLSIQVRRMAKTKGKDMYYLEMMLNRSTIPINNPVTKTQVLDLAAIWSELQSPATRPAASAPPPASNPLKGAR